MAFVFDSADNNCVCPCHVNIIMGFSLHCIMFLNASINSSTVAKCKCIMKIEWADTSIPRFARFIKIANSSDELNGQIWRPNNQKVYQMNHIYSRYSIFFGNRILSAIFVRNCFMFTLFLCALSSLNFLCRKCMLTGNMTKMKKKNVYFAYM